MNHLILMRGDKIKETMTWEKAHEAAADGTLHFCPARDLEAEMQQVAKDLPVNISKMIRAASDRYLVADVDPDNNLNSDWWGFCYEGHYYTLVHRRGFQSAFTGYNRYLVVNEGHPAQKGPWGQRVATSKERVALY